jgi:transcriptional regulator with XRE-family HTH domain
MSTIAVNAIPCRSYAADVKKISPAPNFPQYLVALRKGKKLTQQQLADLAHISVVQLRRYEGGSSQPTLDVIRNLALALGVTTDRLAFGKDERGPDDDLRLQFEAVSRFEPEAKKVVQQVLDSMILQQEARRWSTGRR